MVLPDSRRIPRARHYLGTKSREPIAFRLQDFHLLWFAFPGDSAKQLVFNSPFLLAAGSDFAPRPRCSNGCHLLRNSRFRLFPFRSPLLRESNFLSFPQGTEMVQFPWFALWKACICFQSQINLGFPHSEIHGSKVACTSPWLIAARYVLHRLIVPRHPPYALSSLVSRPLQPSHSS